MAATYSNKFTIEVTTDGLTRIVFADERAKIAHGLPPATANVGEFVMTTDNATDLARHILALVEASKGKRQ